MDQLDAMRVFVAVAKLGSFTAAARRLRLSPSVATRAIAQLEDRLGATVLERTTRSVRVTERGVRYLEDCERILDDMLNAERAVRGEHAEPRGPLNVAAPVMFGRLHVLPIVSGLLAQHPALAVRLMLSDRYVHLIDEAVDVAVRIGALADSQLIAVKLGAVSRITVASPAYLARRGTPRTPADLAGHDLIGYDGYTVGHDWRFTDGAAVHVEPRLIVNSADAAITAAEDGLGVTRVLSYQVRAAVYAGRLVLVLPTFMPPSVPVQAIYPARRFASANVTAFVAAARARFAAEPVVAVDDWRVPPRRKR